MSTPRKELSTEKKEIILQLCRDGMKQTEVVRALEIHTPTICRFLKRYRESGSLENKRRSGRPKKLTRVLRGNRMASLVDITNNFNNDSQIGVCKRTIQRCLHRCDFRKPGIRKKMGVRAVNRVRRVSWARTKLGWTVHENWRNVIFSDEMSIIVSGSGLIKVWRKRTEGFLPECIGYLKQHEGRNLKVMVWGCITYFGQGTLTFVDGNLNSKKYIKLLDDNLWSVVAKNFLDKPYVSR